MSVSVIIRDVRKTEIRFGFKKTEPSKNLTSVQTVFPQQLDAICHSTKKWIKVTLLPLNLQMNNVSNMTETEFSIQILEHYLVVVVVDNDISEVKVMSSTVTVTFPITRVVSNYNIQTELRFLT